MSPLAMRTALGRLGTERSGDSGRAQSGAPLSRHHRACAGRRAHGSARAAVSTSCRVARNSLALFHENTSGGRIFTMSLSCPSRRPAVGPPSRQYRLPGCMWCAACLKKAVAAIDVRASTNIKRDSSVHVLVVDRELPAGIISSVLSAHRPPSASRNKQTFSVLVGMSQKRQQTSQWTRFMELMAATVVIPRDASPLVHCAVIEGVGSPKLDILPY
jgi:hypothetical protein